MRQILVITAGFLIGACLVAMYLTHFRQPALNIVEIGEVGQHERPAEPMAEEVGKNKEDGAEEFEEYLSQVPRHWNGGQPKPTAKSSEKESIVNNAKNIPSIRPPPVRQIAQKGEEVQVSDEDLFWARREEVNPFIKHILEAVDDASSMVLFTGHTAKSLFDMPAPSGPSRVSITATTARDRMSMYRHLTLSGQTRTQTWSDIAALTNQTMEWNSAHYNNLEDGKINRVVRVHNEHKVGDLLLHIIQEAKRRRVAEGTAAKYGNTLITRSEILREMDKGQPPVVLTNSVDENWGFLSTGINTRTTEWINMTNHLRIHEANFHTLQAFLDSDKVLLLLTNTHIAPQLGAHPKVLSLPLGFREMSKHFNKAKQVLASGVKKNRLMQINNSGWGDRAVINEEIKRVFKGTVQNTYLGAKTINDTNRGMGGPVDHAKRKRERLRRKRERERKAAAALGAKTTTSASTQGQIGVEGRRRRRLLQRPHADHLIETAESRFALCPSGLGMDTYRLWQTLMLGTIPVVESNPGFDRTYSRLPVLVVRNYSDLTPQLLRKAYPCFRDNARKFNFGVLTISYWLDLVDQAVRSGNIEHVTEQHPNRNAVCNFLL